MFNFKALFTATLLAATATTAWGKAEVILFTSGDCTGTHQSPTIGMSTGVCHSTYFDYSGGSGYAGSAHFYTDGAEETYYYYPDANCGGSGSETINASGCIEGLSTYKSFMKGA
ncbi:hypothetical protein C8R45DRAFT_1106865 [Mycena sanguinolenta]|nr:hypothetical protein C8R45DRAFT_1106865 [Mycena sanguinolenta]